MLYAFISIQEAEKRKSGTSDSWHPPGRKGRVIEEKDRRVQCYYRQFSLRTEEKLKEENRVLKGKERNLVF